MAQQTFSLGAFVFGQGGTPYTLFQVPQDFSSGLETWGSIHNIPQNDGAPAKRISQVFGVFPKAMQWEARFLGADAETSVRRLKAAHLKQAALPLTLGRNSWDVVIWSLTLKQRSRFDIGFEIEVRPLAERSGSAPTGPIAQGAATNLKSQTLAMQQLQTDAAAADARASAADQQLAATLAAIVAAQPEQSQTTATQLALGGSMSSLIASASALQSSLAGSSLTTDVPTYLWAGKVLGAAQSYLSTLQTFTGQDRALTVPGTGNLFAIAATQLGDWTRYADIASINRIADPFNIGAAVLSLPRT